MAERASKIPETASLILEVIRANVSNQPKKPLFPCLIHAFFEAGFCCRGASTLLCPSLQTLKTDPDGPAAGPRCSTPRSSVPRRCIDISLQAPCNHQERIHLLLQVSHAASCSSSTFLDKLRWLEVCSCECSWDDVRLTPRLREVDGSLTCLPS